MVLGEGESVPYRGVPYFGEGVWLIEGFHCTYRKIKKRKHTCVVTCSYKDPMNMYVNEIQMSNVCVYCQWTTCCDQSFVETTDSVTITYMIVVCNE